MAMEGGKEEFYPHVEITQIENPTWLCLEKAAGRDGDMDSKWLAANRVVASLGSKLWSQRKVSLHLTLIP